MNNKPIKRISNNRVSGAIWKHDTESGSFYSMKFDRSIRDGDRYKNVDSFRPNDLGDLLLTLLEAYAFAKQTPAEALSDAMSCQTGETCYDTDSAKELGDGDAQGPRKRS